VTRLGRSTLLLNSKAPEQMTAECWRPRWNRLASSTSCFGSLACLQSSSSSNEPGELSQWLCHDDSTLNIVLDIIIFIINPDSDVCRIALRLLWIHYRVSISHFAEYRENRAVAV